MDSKRSVYSLSTLLTESKIVKLNNQGGVHPLFVRDTALPGFGLKVSCHDSKSFFIEARRASAQGGATQRITLGKYPVLALLEARNKALEALRTVKYSSDGFHRKERSQTDLRGLAEAFLRAKEPVLRTSTMRDYTMVLRKEYFSSWMNR